MAHVDHLQHLVGDGGLADPAAGRHVGAHVLAVVDPTEGGIGAIHLERVAIHHEEPGVARRCGGQVLLRHHIAVAGNRLDDLVQVGRLLVVDQEDTAAARALQRLEHRTATQVVDEAVDLLGVTADQRLRAYPLREVLEVGLADRGGQRLGVVDHQHAGGGRQLAEGHPGGAGPGTLRVRGGVRAQHQHVEVAEHGLLAAVLLHVCQVAVVRTVVLARRGVHQRAERAVGKVVEVPQPDQPRLVTHLVGGQRKPGGGVAGVLGGHVVDDESDLHGAPVFGVWVLCGVEEASTGSATV